MHANMKAMANFDPPTPSWSPIAVARETIVAAWDDGIPPDPRSCLRSSFFSLYLQIHKIIHYIEYFQKIMEQLIEAIS